MSEEDVNDGPCVRGLDFNSLRLTPDNVHTITKKQYIKNL